MKLSVSYFAVSLALLLAPAACSARDVTVEKSDLEACLEKFFDLGVGEWDYIATTASAGGEYIKFETKTDVKKTSDREWLAILSGGDMNGEETTRISFLGVGKVEHRVLDESESVSIDTYTECHEPDSRGRRKAVSTYSYLLRSIGKEMEITSTAYASGDRKLQSERWVRR